MIVYLIYLFILILILIILNAVSSLDQDECEVGVSNGGCDHFCVNTPGSFVCACRDGYTKLRNGRICQGV